MIGKEHFASTESRELELDDDTLVGSIHMSFSKLYVRHMKSTNFQNLSTYEATKRGYPQMFGYM